MQALIPAAGNRNKGGTDRVSPARGQEAALGGPATSGRPPNRTVTDLVAVAESGLVSSALNQPALGMG